VVDEFYKNTLTQPSHNAEASRFHTEIGFIIDCSQFANFLIKLFRAIERIAIVDRVFVVLEEFHVSIKTRFDVFVKQKLRKDLQLLTQKLENDVHLQHEGREQEKKIKSRKENRNKSTY
jgi:hypothetical protein